MGGALQDGRQPAEVMKRREKEFKAALTRVAFVLADDEKSKDVLGLPVLPITEDL